MKRILKVFFAVLCTLCLLAAAASAEGAEETKVFALVLRETAAEAAPASAEDLAAALATVAEVPAEAQKRLEDGTGSEGEYVTLALVPKHTESGVQLCLEDGAAVEAAGDLLIPGKGVYDLSAEGASLNEIFMDMHTWDQVLEATCAGDVAGTQTCTLCGFSREVNLPALAHDYGFIYTKSPDCGRPGEKLYTCKVCGDSYTEIVPMFNSHLWDDGVVITEATCGEDGETLYTCRRCDATKIEYTPGDKHLWGGGAVTREAT